MTKREIETWLIRRVEATRGLPPGTVDARETFIHYGLDSLATTRMLQELSSELGRPLAPTLAWEYPSIEALARYLIEGEQAASPALERTSRGDDEPIAIVGMACRFPGAPDVAAFWSLLSEGRHAITEAPRSRWMESAGGDAPPAIRFGAFLGAIDGFDPLFFGISPREARSIDPQQRLVLELCWEALEDAGIRPETLRGTRTSVFAAAIWADYAVLHDRLGAEHFDQYTVTGWHHSIIANRVSYLFGLNGPSFTLDAACSSGLVTVHLACESLRRGESTLSLCPAVSLNVLADSAVGVARFGALSEDGRCRVFDAGANGYVRGEGGGVVVLKRLTDAIRDANSIYGLIRGSAVNNDGASNGMTAPNPAAQRALLQEAYRAARVDTRDVQYIEAHGTGTPLGDPIEAKALGAVVGAGRDPSRPLLVGSAKTNVGHLEGAAGVVGLIKATLALQNRKIPPSLHFSTPNPHIPFDELGLEVPTSLRPFPEPDRGLFAGVSAFGLGGTNAHAVLEEWPQPLDAELAAAVEVEQVDASKGVVFVFPGQGSQWHGMARWLLQAEPVFRATLDRCDALVKRFAGFSLIDELLARREDSRLDRIDVSLPALIAFDIGVAALWRSLGVEPAAVVGHSTGEIAAAHVAGALDIEDTMRIICAYGRMTARFSGQGAMALVELGWDAAARALEGVDGRVFPAIEDSAETTVLAGEPAALDAALKKLEAVGVVCRRVSMNVAPHCPLVDSARAELGEVLRGIHPRPSRIPLVSEVTGAEVKGESLDPTHWVRNFGDPARFSRAIDALIDEGHRVFVDVGPHPITKLSVTKNLRRAGAAGVVLPSVIRGEERKTLADTLATLRAIVGGAKAALAPSAHLLPLSAKSPAALRALAEAYRARLATERGNPADLRAIAYTASVHRSHHPHRLAVVGASKGEIAAALEAFGRDEPSAAIARGAVAAGAPKVVFVFPGQGSQWSGMGRQLLAREGAFREAILACDAAIQKEAGFSVCAELDAEEPSSRLEAIDIVQPVLFAIEVALAALWRSWGVEPSAVVGHSMGEVAAAYVAGALSLEDAAGVICRRSRLLRRMSGQGAMALVDLPKDEAERALAGYEDRLSVAVSNGPRSTVLAGDPAALDEVLAALVAKEIFCRRVKVDVASHSPQMDPLREDLLAALREVSPKKASIVMRSTVTGQVLSGAELGAAYWADNLRQPVRFSSAVQDLLREGTTLFLEMSPNPILLPSIEETLRACKGTGVALPSLRRGQPERASLLESLGRLYVEGCPVELERLYPERGRVVALPTYPWQRERYWIETPSLQGGSFAPWVRGSGSGHPLLGPAVSSSARRDEWLREQLVSTEAIAYLADHRVQGEVVFPGSGYVEMALAAGKELFGGDALVLRDIRFEQMLALPPAGARVAQLVLTGRGGREASFSIASRDVAGAMWMKHASGTLQTAKGESDPERLEEPLSALRQRLSPSMADEHYRRMREAQLEYGPAFQGLVELWTGEGSALGRVRLPDGVKDEGYVLHPALLDACFQVSARTFAAAEDADTHVPVAIRRIAVHHEPGRQAWVLSVPRVEAGADARERVVDIQILDEEGRVLVAIEELRLRRLEAGARKEADSLADCVHDVVWQEATALPEASLPADGAWLLFADRGAVTTSLGQHLLAQRQRCVRVFPGTSYARLEPDLFRIDPTNREDYRRLLRDAFGEEGRCLGAAHLFSLDSAPLEQATAQSLWTDLAHGSVSATYLAQALVRHGFRDPPRLFLVTRGAQAARAEDLVSVSQAPLLGLGKTIALEHPELKCTRIDLDPAGSEREPSLLLRELAGKDREDQVALRAEDRYVARLVRTRLERADEADVCKEPANGRPFQLQIQSPGVLERLSLHEMTVPSPGPGEVVLEIEAAGLNFRDVLMALGVLPDDAPGADGLGPRLGGECAGKVVAVSEGVTEFAPGQDVIALGERAFGSFMKARQEWVVQKPENLRWEEAAALPVVFLTAYYGLAHVGRLRRGERVLIHAGAGGVGLAAIQWAKHVGAEIFATAGSEEKRAYLRSLGVPHVLDSRSLAFAEEIRRITKGEGIDVVLNSLSGDFIPASMGLLRDHGRFVEIGKRDYYENRPLDSRPFLRNLSFSLVDLRGLLQRPSLMSDLLHELFGMFAAGKLSPLPVRAFPVSRAAEAFQHMAAAKHIGKIVITMKDPEAQIVPARRDGPTSIRADRGYLITGGLGGLGLSLSRWLVEQGARQLVLVGRRGPSEEARRSIAAMEEAGARVVVAQLDVAKTDDMARLSAMLGEGMPPLAGVVHAAAVLDDRTMLELTEENFRSVFAPKALGAWNLHALSQGKELDFFVMYSSSASLFGSPGQGNYTAANAFLDALSHRRRAMGLPAMSIQWGAFSEVGLAAAQENRGQRLAGRGTASFTPAEGLDAFCRLLLRPRPEVGIVRFDLRQFIEFYPGATGVPFFAELPRSEGAPSADNQGARTLLEQLSQAPPERRGALLEGHVLTHMGRVLRLDPARIDRNAPLSSLGMDSLMSLELRNRIEASLGLRLSATILFTYPNVASLASHLLAQLGSAASKQEDTSRPRGDVPSELSQIKHMSDREAEEAIEAEIAALEGFDL